MSFWSWLSGAVTPNANVGQSSVGPGHNPGDPDGLVVEGGDTSSGERAAVVPSPWDGWPAEWDVPSWGAAGTQFAKLVDTAWACLDLNSSVLSSMPVYRTRGGRVMSPLTWMTNPDDEIYTSWHEFAKQLFWDYQLGEAFVLPMSTGFDGKPGSFRVIPPWLINAEMRGSRRVYNLGSMDVTGEILHIRYKSTTEDAHGHGPLEAAGARMTAAAVLSKYMSELIGQGGVPHFYLRHETTLTSTEADDLLEQWVASRKRNVGKPAVLSGPVTAEQLQMSPKEMAMVELAQFNESRIAILLGVPPFLVGLPSGGDSMTYSNVSSLFDFHDRASIRPKATDVMAAMSGWALPRGQQIELNRDEYTRPAFNERVQGLIQLHAAGVITTEEIRGMERFLGEAPAQALTGGDIS